jgi:hypothetical protein
VLCSRETSTQYMVDHFMSRVMEIWNTSALVEKLSSKRELALQWAGYLLNPIMHSSITHILSALRCVDFLYANVW